MALRLSYYDDTAGIEKPALPPMTAAQWTTLNPVLPLGVLGIESDTLLGKFGDGATAWTSLRYSWVDLTNAQSIAGAKTWSGLQTFNGVTYPAAGFRYGMATVTGVAGGTTATLATSTGFLVECNAAAGAVTINGLATATAGYTWLVRKTDSSANPVTFQPGASLETWTGTTWGTAGAVRLWRQGDSIMVRTTSTSGAYALPGGPFNPLSPAPDPIYVNTTIPAGNTVSATGNGTANLQKVFTSGPTIPANYFYPGVKLVLTGWGYYTATAAVNVQPEVYAGGTSGVKLIDAGALGLPSTTANCRYDFEIRLKCLTAGSSGTMECYGRLIFMNPTANAAGALTFPVGASGSADATATGSSVVTYDTTVSRLIQLSAAYSSATSADTNTLRSIEAVGYRPSVYAA